MFEMQILQAVVEQERVDFPFVDGKAPAFHSIFIHQHDDILQIVGQHVRLVAGGT